MTTKAKNKPPGAKKARSTKMRRASPKATRRPRSVAASEFKAKCLAMLEGVASKNDVIVVTKRGKPIAWVCPMDWRPSPDLRGSVLFEDRIDEPTGAKWEAGM